MPDPRITVDAVRLESRLSAIETKLNEDSLRERIRALESEVRQSAISTTRLDERTKHFPTDKELSELVQRVTRLEVRVAHLPTKGFIITVMTTMGALLAAFASIDRLRNLIGH